MNRCGKLVFSGVVAVALTNISAASAQTEDKKDNAETATQAASGEPAAETASDAAISRERIDQLESQLADLTGIVNSLRKEAEQDDLQALIEEAEEESKAPAEKEDIEDRKFLWGALALQKLNPEISISADFLGQVVVGEEGNFYNAAGERSQMAIREVGIQAQHVLDPYSMFKAAINFFPMPDPGVEVEEIYITWFGIIPSVSLTVGRFRQQFGVINRWHGHDLDQTDYPLALTHTLGEGGLNQTGIAAVWFMPDIWADAIELSIEVTNAENEEVLSGEFFSAPSVMAHLKNYWDLTDATYLELGLSGLYGTNHKYGYVNINNKLANEGWRNTFLGGADLTVSWTPPTKARYQGLTWRSEGYFVYKETPKANPAFTNDWMWEPDGSRIAWGAYSYIDYKFSERWIVGVRGDVALPLHREQDELLWDVVPYLTFWQSEFVYFRLEYSHAQDVPIARPDGQLGLMTDNKVMLQIDWAAGPHKHEKY